MKLDAKLKGGLAWAGLVVVLAVPAADLVIGKQGGAASSVSSLPAATETASIDTTRLVAPPKSGVSKSGDSKTDETAELVAPVPATRPKAAPATDPVVTASVDGKDPVGLYLQKNKTLPDYISDGDGVAAAPAQPAKASSGEVTELASIAPEAVDPPLPLPRSARPKLAPVAAGSEPSALVLTDKEVAKAKQVEPFPLSDEDSAAADEAPVVTGDDLEEWDSGSLADYLARKGLLSDNSGTSGKAKSTGGGYDPDGFYLDQGPNNPDARRDDTVILF